MPWIPELFSDGRLLELRVYHSMWPVMGRYVHRPPMLQHDPDLRASDVVAEYQGALAVDVQRLAGDERGPLRYRIASAMSLISPIRPMGPAMPS